MPILNPTRFYQPRGAFDPAPGGGLDTDYSAWKSSVGSVGATQESATNALIVALKSHSLWTKADRIWLYASENATQAATSIRGLQTHSLVGTPPFNPSTGYTGNGSDYINTNFIPGTHGVAYTQNSASVAAYVRNNRLGDTNISIIGVSDSIGVQTALQPNTFGNGNNMSVNDGGGTAFGASVGTSRGFWAAVRASSSSRLLYRGGSVLGSDTGGSGSISTMPAIFVLAYNNNGSVIQRATDEVSVVWIGGALDATDNANLFTDVEAYMDALGTGVF